MTFKGAKLSIALEFLLVSPLYKFAIPDLLGGPPCLFATFPVLPLTGAGWRGTAQATGTEASRVENIDLKIRYKKEMIPWKDLNPNGTTSGMVLGFIKAFRHRGSRTLIS